jgi:hypothetical protein
MVKLLVIAGVCMSFGACTYDPVTGAWSNLAGWRKPRIEFADSDALERHVAVEQYAREHKGKLPPPDIVVYP